MVSWQKSNQMDYEMIVFVKRHVIKTSVSIIEIFTIYGTSRKLLRKWVLYTRLFFNSVCALNDHVIEALDVKLHKELCNVFCFFLPNIFIGV